MKVLQVIPSIASAHGGPSKALRIIESALLRKTVGSETATTNDDGHGGRFPVPLGSLEHEEGSARRYFNKSFDPYKVSFPFAWWVFRHAKDYDLIHLHAMFSFTSTVAAWAARWNGVPYVVRPLGTLARYGLTRRRPWLKKLSLALVEKPILRSAAAVHFTSAAEMEEAELLGVPIRGVVVPLAVEGPIEPDHSELARRFPMLDPGRYVLFLSRLDRKKNVEGLLEAIRACAGAATDTRWVIAGAGEAAYVAELHARSASLGISDRIVWAGHLDGGLKAAMLSRAALFVLPSYSENFGIAAAEALLAGLPVVLGKGVALAAQAERAGAGVAVDPNPQAIAEAMASYLRDPQAMARASTNARALAEAEFSVDALGDRMVDLYDMILSAPDRKWTRPAGRPPATGPWPEKPNR